MIRDFELVNDIVSGLSDEIYKMTEIAANLFYSCGDRSLLKKAAEKSGLTPDEILAWW